MTPNDKVIKRHHQLISTVIHSEREEGTLCRSSPFIQDTSLPQEDNKVAETQRVVFIGQKTSI